MKSIFLSLIMGFALISMASNNPIEPKSIKVGESSIVWTGKKVTGSHTGTITLQEGTLSFDGDMLTGGNFTINMSTIVCTDLSGDSKGSLEGHLKSPDFFGVESNPTANFKISKVVSRGTPGDYKVIGNVTIKGKTKEIKFLATVKEGTVKAEVTIDRTDFDVKYGSGSFFDSLGDKTIYDDFNLVLNLKY